MANIPNFDADKLYTEVLQLCGAAAVAAGCMAVKTTDFIGQGVDWMAPRAQVVLETAVEKATPVVEGASRRARTAVERVRPALEHARAELVDDYLPRTNHAVHEGAGVPNTEGTLVDRARRTMKISQAVFPTPTKTLRLKRRSLRTVGWTALTDTVAGVGYALWKRSQPIEDPWAEKYWADPETDSSAPATETEEIGGSPKE